jgi:hypothetical protein
MNRFITQKALHSAEPFVKELEKGLEPSTY